MGSLEWLVLREAALAVTGAAYGCRCTIKGRLVETYWSPDYVWAAYCEGPMCRSTSTKRPSEGECIPVAGRPGVCRPVVEVLKHGPEGGYKVSINGMVYELPVVVEVVRHDFTSAGVMAESVVVGYDSGVYLGAFSGGQLYMRRVRGRLVSGGGPAATAIPSTLAVGLHRLGAKRLYIAFSNRGPALVEPIPPSRRESETKTFVIVAAHPSAARIPPRLGEKLYYNMPDATRGCSGWMPAGLYNLVSTGQRLAFITVNPLWRDGPRLAVQPRLSAPRKTRACGLPPFKAVNAKQTGVHSIDLSRIAVLAGDIVVFDSTSVFYVPTAEDFMMVGLLTWMDGRPPVTEGHIDCGKLARGVRVYVDSRGVHVGRIARCEAGLCLELDRRLLGWACTFTPVFKVRLYAAGGEPAAALVMANETRLLGTLVVPVEYEPVAVTAQAHRLLGSLREKLSGDLLRAAALGSYRPEFDSLAGELEEMAGEASRLASALGTAEQNIRTAATIGALQAFIEFTSSLAALMRSPEPNVRKLVRQAYSLLAEARRHYTGFGTVFKTLDLALKAVDEARPGADRFAEYAITKAFEYASRAGELASALREYARAIGQRDASTASNLVDTARELENTRAVAIHLAGVLRDRLERVRPVLAAKIARRLVEKRRLTLPELVRLMELQSEIREEELARQAAAVIDMQPPQLRAAAELVYRVYRRLLEMAHQG